MMMRLRRLKRQRCWSFSFSSSSPSPSSSSPSSKPSSSSNSSSSSSSSTSHLKVSMDEDDNADGSSNNGERPFSTRRASHRIVRSDHGLSGSSAPAATASTGIVLSGTDLVERTIAEKKQRLFERQANDYAEWIENFLERDKLESDLLTSLKSGVILCQLVKAMEPNIATILPQFKFPRPNDSRTMNIFQCVENLNCFRAACKVLGLKDVDLFEPDDLLKGLNKLKVLRTLQCLRQLTGQIVHEEDSEEFAIHEHFNLEFLNERPVMSMTQRDIGSPRALDPGSFVFLHPGKDTDKEKSKATTIPGGIVPAAAAVDAVTTNVLADRHVDAAPSKLHEAASLSDHAVIVEDLRTVPKGNDIDSSSESTKPPKAEAAAASVAAPKPLSERVASVPSIEVPASNSALTPDEPETPDGGELLGVKINNELMEHLLSKVPDEDNDDNDDDRNGDHDDDDDDDQYIGADHVHQDVDVWKLSPRNESADITISKLKYEVEELQELLKTEIVQHVKETQLVSAWKTEMEQEKQEMKNQLDIFSGKLQNSESYIEQLLRQIRELKAENAILRQDNDTLREQADVLQHEVESWKRTFLEHSMQDDSASSMPSLVPLAVQGGGGGDRPQTSREIRRVAVMDSDSNSDGEAPLASSKIGNINEQNIASLRRLLTVRKRNVLTDEERENISNAKSQNAGVDDLWQRLSYVTPIIDTISATERSRQEIIHELISTEEIYCADMDRVIRLFLNPMTDLVGKEEFTQQSFQTIFLNIHMLLKVNLQFLKDLKERQQKQRPVIHTIADIFIKHATNFKEYMLYCPFQKDAMNEVDRLEKLGGAVSEFLKDVSKLEECRKLGLAAFLLMPMQRLTKYPLLLKAILKHTPDFHVDYYATLDAIEVLGQLTAGVNDATKQVEENRRLAALDEQLDWSHVDTYIELKNLSPKRHLIIEGPLTRIPVKRQSLTPEKTANVKNRDVVYVFLFTDFILFTRLEVSDGSQKYTVRAEPLSIAHFRVRNVNDDRNGIGAKYTFLVSSKFTGTIVFQASSQEEKRRWLTQFRALDLIVGSLNEVPDMLGIQSTLSEITQASPRRRVSHRMTFSTKGGLPSPSSSSSSTNRKGEPDSPASSSVATPASETSTAAKSPEPSEEEGTPVARAASFSVSSGSGSTTPTNLPRVSPAGTPTSLRRAASSASSLHSQVSSVSREQTLRPSVSQPKINSPNQIHRRTKSEEEKRAAQKQRRTVKAPSAPKILLKQLVEPEFDGWLKYQTHHMGLSLKSWKQRWFVLKDFCLYSFRSNRADEEAIGMIVLPSYSINAVPDAAKSHVFKAVHPSGLTKTYAFMADTPEVMEIWIEALTHATMARKLSRTFWL